jgi:alkanesulfonate monooxygenase SsuD/methylene tetrahydromethanopterin reductase-like flavin-dependent oxidoreductase (luciferase family)
MSVIAASTRQIRLFPDVVSLPLRPPAVLAKAAASLDLLSGGRVELGLGAGAFWDAINAYGGERRSPKQAITALDEAIQVIRAIWSGQRNLRFEGEHYHLSGAKGGPAPAHPMGIWLGVGGPRALALLGRSADGWVPSSGWAPPERLPELNARIDDAATAAGRDPKQIRRLYNISGSITDRTSRGFLDGPADQWVEELTDLVLAYGMDTFILASEQLDRFAQEVVPAVREEIEKERKG